MYEQMLLLLFKLIAWLIKSSGKNPQVNSCIWNEYNIQTSEITQKCTTYVILFDKSIISDTVHVAMSGIKRYYDDQPSVQNKTTYSIDYRPSLALTGLSSSLSVIGSLVIFLSFYKDRVRSFTFRILVCLTVADFLNAVGNILGVIRYSRFGSSLVITQPSSCDKDNLCVSQSFITVVASLSSFWWTFLAALNHLLHYRGSHCLESRVMWILSHTVGWGIPRK